jgi:hypothetical protein
MINANGLDVWDKRLCPFKKSKHLCPSHFTELSQQLVGFRDASVSKAICVPVTKSVSEFTCNASFVELFYNAQHF